jgi:hypothetical protein
VFVCVCGPFECVPLLHPRVFFVQRGPGYKRYVSRSLFELVSDNSADGMWDNYLFEDRRALNTVDRSALGESLKICGSDDPSSNFWYTIKVTTNKYVVCELNVSYSVARQSLGNCFCLFAG